MQLLPSVTPRIPGIPAVWSPVRFPARTPRIAGGTELVCPGEPWTPPPLVVPPVIQLVCPEHTTALASPSPLWRRDSLSPTSHLRRTQRSWWWKQHDDRAHHPLVQLLGDSVEPGCRPPARLSYEVVRYNQVQHLQRKDIQAAPTAVHCDWESGPQLWSAGHAGQDEAPLLRHVARSGVEPDCHCRLDIRLFRNSPYQ